VSDLYLPVPDHVLTAESPGVYAGAGALCLDEWIERYIESGLHLRDWDERLRHKQQVVERQLCDVEAQSSRRFTDPSMA
jgi:hypothetical protein